MKQEYLTKKPVVAWKAESTRGTYETLVATDTVCVQDLGMPTLTPNDLELDCSNGTLTPNDGTVLVGDTGFEVSFSIPYPNSEMGAGGEVTFEAVIQPLLETAGLSVTDDATSAIVITGDDSKKTSVSFLCNYDGWEYRARGCVVSQCSIDTIAGEHKKLSITLKGVLSSRLEATALSAAATSFTPELCQNDYITIVIGGNTIATAVKSARWIVENVVQPAKTVTAIKGIDYYYFTERKITMEVIGSAFYEGTDQRDDEVETAKNLSTKVTARIGDNASGNGETVAGKIISLLQADTDGIIENTLVIKSTGTSSDTKAELSY